MPAISATPAVLRLLVAPALAAHAQAQAQTPLLQRLYSYQAPPYPRSDVPEVYDYRRQNGLPVPDRPIALVLDVCILIQQELDSEFRPIMHHSAYSSLKLERLVGLGIWVPLCIAIVMAPLLVILGATLPSLAIYGSLSPVCHQSPERSFAIGGAPWAVCQRCSGLYLGLAVACFAPGSLYTLILSHRRASAMIGVLPALVDFCLNCIGIRTNTPSTRFATGFVLGLTLSALLVLGVAELIDRSGARHRSRSAPAFGGS